MNQQLLISMKTTIDMLKRSRAISQEWADKSKDGDTISKSIASGIETTLQSTNFEVDRLEYLINEALKEEGLNFLIEDVKLDGLESEEIA